MPLHACSTEREREGGGEGRGGGKEGRREREGEEERRGGPGSPSLRVTLPPFLCRSPSRSRSLPLRQTNTRCVCMCVVLLPVVAFLPASLSSSSSSPPPSPPSPPALSFPLQTFLLTSSDSAWKKVKGEKIKKKEGLDLFFSYSAALSLPSSPPKFFHTI